MNTELEGSGCGPVRGTVSVFAMRDEEATENRGENRQWLGKDLKWHLSNRSQNYYYYYHESRRLSVAETCRNVIRRPELAT